MHPPNTYTLRPRLSQNINTACSNLFLNDEYSDFSIVVGKGQEETTFPAHRSVVCTQSGFFKIALRGGFKEAEEAVIKIPDESPKDIYRLLSYLYTNTYRDHSDSYYAAGLDREDAWDAGSPMDSHYFHYATRTNIAMYRLADKYDIQGLGQLALDKQLQALDNVSMVYESCWATNVVYSAFDDRRDRMRVMVGEHVLDGPLAEWGAMSGSKVEIREIRRCMETHGDFAWKFIKKLYERIGADNKQWEKLYEKNREVKKARDEALQKVKTLEEKVKTLSADLKKWKASYKELEQRKGSVEAQDGSGGSAPANPPNRSTRKRVRQE